MPKLMDLQEKRSKLAKEIRDAAAKFNEQGKKWKDAEERGNWEKLNADYDANKKELDDELSADAVQKRTEQVEEEERSRSNPRDPIPGREDSRHRGNPVGDQRSGMIDVETRQMAFRGWMSAQMGYDAPASLQDKFDTAMRSCGIKPWQRGIDLRVANQEAVTALQRDWRNGSPQAAIQRCEDGWDKRAMSNNFFASGGGLVFPTLMKRVEINMLAFGGVSQVATTIVTSTGEETGMPTADDTGNEGAQIGENVSVGADTPPTIGKRKWGAWTFTSKPVLVPFSLLQDSAFDIPGMLGDMFGQRLGRGTNRKFTVGNGVNTCMGIVTAAAAGPSSAGSGAIAYGDLVKLEHSVDPAYRNGAGYMCHDTTLLAIRLLLDSQNRPLWTSGTDTNSQDRLNFRPLTINQHMDAGTTTGNKSLLFGQFSQYYIRRAGMARFYRLEERYRDTDQDGFVMLLRADGNLLNAGTPPVKYLLQS